MQVAHLRSRRVTPHGISWLGVEGYCALLDHIEFSKYRLPGSIRGETIKDGKL